MPRGSNGEQEVARVKRDEQSDYSGAKTGTGMVRNEIVGFRGARRTNKPMGPSGAKKDHRPQGY